MASKTSLVLVARINSGYMSKPINRCPHICRVSLRSDPNGSLRAQARRRSPAPQPTSAMIPNGGSSEVRCFRRRRAKFAAVKKTPSALRFAKGTLLRSTAAGWPFSDWVRHRCFSLPRGSSMRLLRSRSRLRTYGLNPFILSLCMIDSLIENKVLGKDFIATSLTGVLGRHYRAIVGRWLIWLWLGGDFEISHPSTVRLCSPRTSTPKQRRTSSRRCLRLLGIFLDAQAPAEYNIYQTNTIRIVNGM